MTEREHAILQTILELDAAAKRMPAARPRADLLPLFARLDELTRQLPNDTAPDLLHYLRQHSFEKARLWLQGKDEENVRGNCGH